MGGTFIGRDGGAGGRGTGVGHGGTGAHGERGAGGPEGPGSHVTRLGLLGGAIAVAAAATTTGMSPGTSARTSSAAAATSGAGGVTAPGVRGGAGRAATPALWDEFRDTPYTHPQIPYVGRAGYRGGERRFPRRRVVANVLEYGALPDGPADAAPAINAAVEAAGAAGGGTVLVPPGTFRIDNLIRIGHSNVVLKGAGSGRTRSTPPGASRT